MMNNLWLQMISRLQGMQDDNSLWRGSITIVTKRFDVAHSTVYQLWEHVACMHAMGNIISPEINSQKKSRHPPIYPKEFIQEGVKIVLLQKRHTQRKLAALMGLPKTTVHHWIVASTIHVHCNSLKPVLTEENKVTRLLMALHFRDSQDLTKYWDMHDWIHLDEIWFLSPSPRGENLKMVH